MYLIVAVPFSGVAVSVVSIFKWLIIKGIYSGFGKLAGIVKAGSEVI